MKFNIKGYTENTLPQRLNIQMVIFQILAILSMIFIEIFFSDISDYLVFIPCVLCTVGIMRLFSIMKFYQEIGVEFIDE